MSNTKKHIASLHINGMDGRIMRLPAPKNKKRQILLLYGHHASLERLSGLAEVLNKHGAVTMPDLPGFGGMDSFYEIGQKPSFDNYADYIASLVKLYYKRQKVTIIAMSYSAPIVVRMLQKYPELGKKVELFVSISGFVRRDEFIFDFKTYWGIRTLGTVFSHKLTAGIMRHVFLTRPVISTTYKLVAKRHSKMKNARDERELKRRIDFETGLWQINDVRTRFKTISQMLTIDLVNEKVTSDIQVYHVIATDDRYFNNEVVKQHLHVIFKRVEMVSTEMPNHAPSIMATAKEAQPYVPLKLQKILG